MTDAQLPALPGEVYVLAPHLPALAEEIVDRDRRRGAVLRAAAGARLAARCGAACEGALAEFVELARGGAVGRAARWLRTWGGARCARAARWTRC